MKPASLVAVIFLGLIGLGHLLRVVFQVEVTANGIHLPMWMSIVACVFTWALLVALWTETRRKQRTG